MLGPCKFAISASDVRGGISAKKAIRHITARHGSGRAARNVTPSKAAAE